MTNPSSGHSPNYYIRKKLMKNKPAMSGLFFIILTSLIAIAAYLIMPDNTPDANDGAIQIRKKAPGFQATFIKIKKNYPVEDQGFFHKLLYGQESKYNIIPVTGYRIENSKVIYTEFGRLQEEKELDIYRIVYPQHVERNQYEEDNIRNKSSENPSDDPYEAGQSSESHLLEKFKKQHIEIRTYWLGTDRAGRDLLSRLIYGTRISLSIGLIAVLISVFLGLSLGALAGFQGGYIDQIVVWIMSVVWSIPGIMLVIAISIALQSRGVWVAYIAVGLTMWVDVGRVIRGQIIAIKQKNYVEAARAIGLKDIRIVYFHIFPNIIGPLVVIATVNFAAAILLEAGLSFLGLSVQPPTPSWGSMIFEGFNVLGTKNSWHLIVFPGMAVSLLVLSFNLLGNGLRDAIDPKTFIRS